MRSPNPPPLLHSGDGGESDNTLFCAAFPLVSSTFDICLKAAANTTMATWQLSSRTVRQSWMLSKSRPARTLLDENMSFLPGNNVAERKSVSDLINVSPTGFLRFIVDSCLHHFASLPPSPSASHPSAPGGMNSRPFFGDICGLSSCSQPVSNLPVGLKGLPGAPGSTICPLTLSWG